MNVKSKFKKTIKRAAVLLTYLFVILFSLSGMIILDVKTVTDIFTYLFFVSPVLGAVSFLISWNSKIISRNLSKVKPEHVEVFSRKLLWINVIIMAFFNVLFGFGAGFGLIPPQILIISTSVQLVYYILLFMIIEIITIVLNENWPTEDAPRLVKLLHSKVVFLPSP